MVESVQLPLADRLERLIETNHPDEPRLFARALGLLADFRSNQFTLPFNSKSRSVEVSRIPGVDGGGGGGWQSRRNLPTYYFGHFSRKLHEIEKFRPGWGSSLASFLRSVNKNVSQGTSTKFLDPFADLEVIRCRQTTTNVNKNFDIRR